MVSFNSAMSLKIHISVRVKMLQFFFLFTKHDETKVPTNPRGCNAMVQYLFGKLLNDEKNNRAQNIYQHETYDYSYLFKKKIYIYIYM